MPKTAAAPLSPVTGKPPDAIAATLSFLNERTQGTATERAYKAFQQRYKRDRVAFVRDCFRWDTERGEGPCFYQEDLLRELDGGCRRLSWRGPRGARKTSTVAWVILHFVLVHDGHEKRDWKVATTASVGRQLTEFLWPEIHKWIRRLRWDVIGREPFREGKELMTEGINLSTGRAYAFVSNDPDKVEGCHADDVLIVFDESKAVPEESRKAVMGGVTGAGEDTAQNATVIAVSTPGAPSGWFYDIHRGDNKFRRWKAIHITQEMCIQAGALSRDGLEELKDECGGEKTALYKQRGLGEFAADDVMGIFPLEHIEAAEERWRVVQAGGGPADHLTSLGVDVADGGQDDTVLAPCYGNFVGDLITLPKYPKIANDGVSETMAMVGDIKNFVAKNDLGEPVVVVDANGVGAGVASRLKELSALPEHRFTVQSFVAQRKTDKKVLKVKDKPKEGERKIELAFGEEVPADEKAAAYLEFAFMLHPDSGFNLALPPHSRLRLEATTAKRLPPDSDGKVKIVSKDKHREALDGKSPDYLEAVIMGATAGRLAKKKKRKMRVFSFNIGQNG